jgi:hypothetical protein
MFTRTILTSVPIMLALSWSQATLAQQECGDIVFTDDISSRFPEVQEACQGIVERDGRQYAHFQARITRVRGDNVEAEFRLPNGDYGRPVSFSPPPEARVRIAGRSYRYSELDRGQELDVYLPPDRWEIAVHEDPSTDFAAATNVTTISLSQPERQVATLPATASRFPWFVVIGFALIVLGTAIAGPRTGRDGGA